MAEIFTHVVIMSAAGGALGLLLMMLRPATSKVFGSVWQYYIWISVLLVFILPVSFSTPNVLSKIPALSQTADTAAYEADTSRTARIAAEGTEPSESAPEAFAGFSVADVTGFAGFGASDAVALAGYVWIITAAAVFAVKLAKYLKFSRLMFDSSSPYNTETLLPNRVCIRRSPMIQSPLLTGIIRPVIYIPERDISETEMRYILLHELTHYKRKDILYKWASTLVLCIHWFNPVSYIIMRRINEDCEISCDYLSAKNLCTAERKSYMNTILSLLSEPAGQAALTTQMAGSKKLIKRRFTMITNIKNTSRFTAALSVITAAALTSVTVFASGIINGYEETDNADIAVYRYDDALELQNEPFAIDNVIYLPVRETLTALGCDNNFITFEDMPASELEYNSVNIGTTAKAVKISVPAEYIKTEAYAEASDPGLTLLGIGMDLSTICGIKIPDTAAILKDGTSYVPCTVFEMMKKRYSGIADGFSVEWQNRDDGSTVRIGTDVRPYSEQQTSKLTLRELTVISLNTSSFDGWELSYLDKFIPDIDSSNDTSVYKKYTVSDTYSLIAEGSPDNVNVWLWSNGSAINLSLVKFDGSPWWE